MAQPAGAATARAEASEPANHAARWQALPWDTEFFDVAIGRIDLHDLTLAEITAAEDEARDHGLVCLYADLDPADMALTFVAQELGYRLVEVALDLVHPTGHVHDPPPTTATVRTGTVDDLPSLADQISLISPWSRYAVDPRFGIGPAERLHRAWVERAAAGEDGRRLLVAEDDGEITAITTLRTAPDDPRIDLIATTRPRSGAAQALVDHAFQLFGRGLSRGGPIAARNTVSMRFSENMGYRIAATRYLHHRWLDDGADARARETIRL